MEVSCPKCNSECEVPGNRGRQSVKCRNCQFEFDFEFSTPERKWRKTVSETWPPIPPSRWGSAIICLFICLPLGIVALICAARVEPLYRSRDFDGAESASKAVLAMSLTGLLVTMTIFLFYTLMIANK